MLDPLGIDATGQAAYLTVIKQPDAGVSDTATFLGESEDTVRSAVDRLADRALIAIGPDDSNLVPVDPEIALSVLLAQRQDAIAKRQHRMKESRLVAVRHLASFGDQQSRIDPEIERLTGSTAVRARSAKKAAIGTEEARRCGRGPMKIAVIGLGYVGQTTALGLADMGHHVVGQDIRAEVVHHLNGRRSHISEPGLHEALDRAILQGRFVCSTTIPDPGDIDAYMICVGTPSADGGKHNLGAVRDATDGVARAIAHASGPKPAVVLRSTFAPGTMRNVILPVFHRNGLDDDNLTLIYNPEFLREGTAFSDFRHPSRTVAGIRAARERHVLESIYTGTDSPVMATTWEGAEMVKLADNTWHAVKITFANELGRLCRGARVPTKEVVDIFLADTLLNVSEKYLVPGRAFGGSCLPKDVRAVQELANANRIDVPLIQGILRSNRAQLDTEYDYVCDAVKPQSRILLMGLAFKNGTGDIRGSASVDLASRLIEDGHTVDIYDPLVTANSSHPPRYSNVLARLVDEQVATTRQYDSVIISSTGPLPPVKADNVIDVQAAMSS